VQKRRKVFSDIFVNWDEAVFQQQALDPTAL
jgi:hypothetical protein